jgi:hypothetical protein
MPSITRNRESRLNAARGVDPAICLCGTRLAPALHDLGSLWCHDCREDANQRALVLQELRRGGIPTRFRRAWPWSLSAAVARVDPSRTGWVSHSPPVDDARPGRRRGGRDTGRNRAELTHE